MRSGRSLCRAPDKGCSKHTRWIPLPGHDSSNDRIDQLCGSGFYPRDRQLGIEKTCFSPATVRMMGTVGSMVSFQEGSQLLRELAGIGIDASQVERDAEALGAEIAADERLHTGPLGDDPLPPTLYLGLDGTGIPMRAEELAGRAGKQTDGSAKTREVNICAVWSAEA